MSTSTLDALSDALVNQLSNSEAFVRQRARHKLVAIGQNAVSAVIPLANSLHDHVRWECARILASIGDSSTVATLINLLEDSNPPTRWDSALGSSQSAKMR